MRRIDTGEPRVVVRGATFALDHLTVIETTPLALGETAAGAGYDRICTFVRSIDGLGGPTFDLSRDQKERKATRAAFDSLGVSVDVAYPFTISDKTAAGDFEADLACAAELGAKMANLLVFARDPQRILDETRRFCERAAAHGLGVAIEMVPASTVKTLDQAADLVRAVGRDVDVGINLDVLHLYRSGAGPADLPRVRDQITYLQICDGPLHVQVESRRHEASLQRLRPGEGEFALGEVMTLLADVPASLEIPDAEGLAAGTGPASRASAVLALALAIPR